MKPLDESCRCLIVMQINTNHKPRPMSAPELILRLTTAEALKDPVCTCVCVCVGVCVCMCVCVCAQKLEHQHP